MKHGLIVSVFILVAIIGMQTHFQPNAEACGGLFCQNVPVDQQAERIIFAVNTDGTISAYVQINYTGSAPDFSWVVPVPNTPEVDVAEVTTFDELSTLTQPVFIPPDFPDCAMVNFSALPEESVVLSGNSDDVDVLASGSVGPYNYAVITSPDPDALVIWLRENEYRVTEEMEPLIHVYNDEGMVFLAMKLKGEAGVQDIQPVKLTYRSDRPMIPLRLTAVAAMPNMSIVTWIFAEEQAYTVNYARPMINDKDVRIFWFGGGPIPIGENGLPTVNPPNNYLQLVDQTVDLYEGRAMITEYASPTNPLTDGVTDPLLQELVNNYGYLTRFFAHISPEEMTVDPVFEFDGDLPEMSNIHDLTEFDPEVVYGCKDQPIQIEVDKDVLPQSGR